MTCHVIRLYSILWRTLLYICDANKCPSIISYCTYSQCTTAMKSCFTSIFLLVCLLVCLSDGRPDISKCITPIVTYVSGRVCHRSRINPVKYWENLDENLIKICVETTPYFIPTRVSLLSGMACLTINTL